MEIYDIVMQPDREELRAYLGRDQIYEWRFTNEDLDKLNWNRTISLNHCVPYEEEEEELNDEDEQSN